MGEYNSYGVRFIGDFYSLFTVVTAKDEEQAERAALAVLQHEYRFDLTGTYNEIDIELEGAYA